MSDPGSEVPAAAAQTPASAPPAAKVTSASSSPRLGSVPAPITISYAQASKVEAKLKEAAAAATATTPAPAAGAPPKHTNNKKASLSALVVAQPNMQRARSAESTPLQSPTNNPHPSPEAAFSPQAPIPLSQHWSWYLDDTNLWGVTSIAECLQRMGYLGTVDSIQGFWCFWNAFEKKLLTEKKLGALSCAGHMGSGPPPPVASPPAASPTSGGTGGNGRYNWRIFDSQITPVWEDEAHTAGGKYVLRCGHGDLRATKYIWTKLVLSMIGASFLHQDVICGCVLACRPHKKEIQVWIKHTPPKLTEPKVLIVADAAASDTLPDAPVQAVSASSSTSSTDSASIAPASPSSSPAASPTAAAPAAASKAAVCTCHIDPVICMANDIRFLLGVPLSQPNSNSGAIKIEYTPHEVTMADVAARNKRLKSKMHARRESDRGSQSGSSADQSKNVAKKVVANMNEKDRLAHERAEREKKRAIDFEKDKKEKEKAWMEQKAGEKAAAKKPSASADPPKSSAQTPKPTPSPAPGSSPPAPTLSYPQRKNTWADASDADEELDLGIESSDYATSTAASNASSVAGTPIHSGQMPTRTLAGGPRYGGRKVSAGSMHRQSSDPTIGDTSALMHHLDALARQDTRTFEGTVGDSGMRGSRPGPPNVKALYNPANYNGNTPLKMSGESGYHPEPDSPGYNGTPAPSPSTTPFGFQTPVDGGSTPTPRSPFTAHSPRGDRSRADSRILTTRGAGRLSSGGGFGPNLSPNASPDGTYETYPDDASDLEDEQSMLQYDMLSPSFDHARGNSFQLNRTRDMLRVPMDLENLSLPPAGSTRQPQRLMDPTNKTGGSSSIFAMVGREGEMVAPLPARAGTRDALSKLIVAASPTPTIGESGHSAFAAPGSQCHTPSVQETPVSAEEDSSTSPTYTNGYQRKKSSAAAPKKRASNKPPKVVEEVSIARRAPKVAKARSTRTYIIWGVGALTAALLIYFLFFTTLAPAPKPFFSPITEKTTKIKAPKIPTKQ